jgi:hypothetical protein
MNLINGKQAAFAGNGTAYGDNGAFIYQDVGPTVAGANYALSVLIGQRTDLSTGTYEIVLGRVADGTFSVFAAAINPVIPAPGTWALATLTYNNAVATTDLFIILVGGRGSGVAQASFDNVALSYSVVPKQ